MRVLTLEDVNADLKAAGVRLRVVARGQKLSVRGVLPTLEGTKVQQYLSLGLDHSPYGLQKAKSMAMSIWSDLQIGQFDWERWGRTTVDQESCGYWLEKYKREYLSHSDRTEATWKRDHWVYLKKLSSSRKLTGSPIF